jgi:hypothetical protein
MSARPAGRTNEARFRFHGSTPFPPERLVQVWLRIAFRLPRVIGHRTEGSVMARSVSGRPP